MELLAFQTRTGQRIEVSHSVVESTNADDVMAGDHVLRIATPSGIVQVALTPEQWGKLVDTLTAAIRKH